MQTHAAKLKQELEAAGYRFVRGDVWECHTGPVESPEWVDSSKSLGDLINSTAKALGVQ